MTRPDAKPVVLIGIGEMGGVFARGLLRTGHPVYPVTRDTPIVRAAADWPTPRAVLVAVGEPDLAPVLDNLPEVWADRLILLQNELLPRDFAHLRDPTVISVWFEKKPGMEARIILPSPVFGPQSGLLNDALGALEIPVTRLSSAEELRFELVVKNLYILTSNIAGLRVDGTVDELWRDHQDLARAVAVDVIALQESLIGTELDREALIRAMRTAFAGDPGHRCKGRSAPARLARAVARADELDLSVPTLRDIAQRDLPKE